MRTKHFPVTGWARRRSDERSVELSVGVCGLMFE